MGNETHPSRCNHDKLTTIFYRPTLSGNRPSGELPLPKHSVFSISKHAINSCLGAHDLNSAGERISQCS